jgi:hypothetical protein
MEVPCCFGLVNLVKQAIVTPLSTAALIEDGF